MQFGPVGKLGEGEMGAHTGVQSNTDQRVINFNARGAFADPP
jgi:hypothetical protein